MFISLQCRVTTNRLRLLVTDTNKDSVIRKIKETMRQTENGTLIKRDELVEIFPDFNERLCAGDFGCAEYDIVVDSLVFRLENCTAEVQQIIREYDSKGKI